MRSSESIIEIAKALCAFQGELPPAPKSSENPFFKSHYADLEACVSIARPLLLKHGLSVTQTTELVDSKPLLITTLIHTSGQWIEGILPIVVMKNDPQALGSGISYARRYAFCAILGIVTSDDDAEAAMGRGHTDVAPPPKESKSSAESKSEHRVLKDSPDRCSACGGKLKKSEKKGTWFCENFSDKSLKHDYLTQDQKDQRIMQMVANFGSGT